MDKIKIKKKTKSEVEKNLLKYLKKNKIIEDVSDEEDDSYGKLSILSISSAEQELGLNNQEIIISRLRNKINFLEQEILILENNNKLIE